MTVVAVLVVPHPMEAIHQSNESRKPDIVGASVTLLVLPTLAVLLRFLSRWMSRAGLWVRR